MLSIKSLIDIYMKLPEHINVIFMIYEMHKKVLGTFSPQ